MVGGCRSVLGLSRNITLGVGRHLYLFGEALNDQVHHYLLERPESDQSRALDIHKGNGRNGRRTDSEH